MDDHPYLHSIIAYRVVNLKTYFDGVGCLERFWADICIIFFFMCLSGFGWVEALHCIAWMGEGRWAAYLHLWTTAAAASLHVVRLGGYLIYSTQGGMEWNVDIAPTHQALGSE